MHRSLRLASVLALACAAACSSNNRTIVYVIAPDGGDPFLGDDAATQARITLENDAGTSTTVPVMANGSFQIDVNPTSPTEISRIRIEALRGGDVIATGISNPVQWAASGYVAVLMQYPDSVTAAPQALPNGRADCQLLVLGNFGEFAGCFTAPQAQNEALAPAVYDSMHQGLATNFQQNVPGNFTGDATVVIAGNKLYVLQGADAIEYTGSGSVNPNGLDVSLRLPLDGNGHSERTGLVRSSVHHSSTGGWLLGGNISGVPSTRVDHFTSGLDETRQSVSILFDRAAVQPLTVARSAPQVIQLDTSDASPRLLLAGGNAPGTAFAETYKPDNMEANVALVLDDDTNRTNAAVACIARDTNGCTHLIIVGGRNGSTMGDDMIIRVPVHTNDPIEVVRRGHWLNHPRNDARVALAEGGRLLVAGGDDPNGQPVTQLEALDVHNLMATPTSLDVGPANGCAHPMVAALSNGTVVIMGGTRDGAACTDIAFYRH